MAGGDKRIRIEDDGVDRFTELPVNLRGHILDCLSIKDAVATSVLSSKWRYCWTGLRKLVFDDKFWNLGKDSTALEHARAIDRVLMRHSGPIREFTLFIPDLKGKRMDINMWLHVLSNNGVQKVEIDAFDYTEGFFPMPSGLFTCQELEELSLCSCTLTLPSDFKGFKNLTSLSLNCIYIASDILESLISGCVLLEKLSLRDMMSVRSIEAHNLKSFYYEDLTSDRIIFKDIPKLTRVSLLSTSEDRISRQNTHSMLEQLCSLFRITKFTFDFLLLAVQYIISNLFLFYKFRSSFIQCVANNTRFLIFLQPLCENCLNSTLTPLENLKSLTLRSVDLCLLSDVLFTLYLVRSAPNLRNLTLHLYSIVWGDDDRKLQRDAAKLLKAEAKKRTSYNNIQTIKIRGVQGLPHESLLIKLLQTRCQKLRSIIIKTGR